MSKEELQQINEVEPRYMRAKGLAKRYSIGLSTVWKMAKDGIITPYKATSRVTLFKVTEFEDSLKRKGLK